MSYVSLSYASSVSAHPVVVPVKVDPEDGQRGNHVGVDLFETGHDKICAIGIVLVTGQKDFWTSYTTMPRKSAVWIYR
jgi:hypothetical protein